MAAETGTVECPGLVIAGDRGRMWRQYLKCPYLECKSRFVQRIARCYDRGIQQVQRENTFQEDKEFDNY
ncbi:hypothetical protein N7517_006652 [Penicillium concentricum]|uniref:Uncharacterized protein n=1 Tax=Penicillium concentricum TaxID=293559 RepID=A0A9W9S9N9_9EURO|nr:uncharacterized protein N7517_006652 [Penicillium concentricum]KAJ5374646.1 hypothetical protein N7517_006652 [Penicillium concentricum]